jgi:hypothetical protein
MLSFSLRVYCIIALGTSGVWMAVVLGCVRPEMIEINATAVFVCVCVCVYAHTCACMHLHVSVHMLVLN